MKRIISVFLIITFSIIYIFRACNMDKEVEVSPNHNVSSGRAAGESATGGAIVNENFTGQSDNRGDTKTDTKEMERRSTVIDETGKKCTLKLDGSSIDTTDYVGVSPSACWFGNIVWSQVYKNHFFYVCYKYMDNGYEYSVYKDKGEKLGAITLQYDSSLVNLCIYKDKFYIVLDANLGGYLGEYRPSSVSIVRQIGTLDLNEGKMKVIYNVYNYEGHPRDGWSLANFNYYMPYIFYGDKIYFVTKDKEGDWTLALLGMDERTKKEIVCKYDKINTKHITEKLYFMNHKIYYGEQKGQKIKIYCFDLENCEKSTVLSFHCKKDRNASLGVQIDESYLYCDDYIIPINGGKIVKKSLQYLSEDSFVHNSKYIFYLDTKYKLHRVDKGNLQKDTVVSNNKFFSADCTENELYLKGYDKKWFESDYYKSLMGRYAEGEKEYDYDIDDCTAYEVDNEEMVLYTMDFDGANLRKIKY